MTHSHTHHCGGTCSKRCFGSLRFSCGRAAASLAGQPELQLSDSLRFWIYNTSACRGLHGGRVWLRSKSESSPLHQPCLAKTVMLLTSPRDVVLEVLCCKPKTLCTAANLKHGGIFFVEKGCFSTQALTRRTSSVFFLFLFKLLGLFLWALQDLTSAPDLYSW